MAEKDYYQSLKDGLEDAVAFINGDISRGRVIELEAPDPIPMYEAEDVIRTRRDLNLTQSALAYVIGVSAGTVDEWEKGKNRPSGTASRLLYLLDGDHSLLDRLIAR